MVSFHIHLTGPFFFSTSRNKATQIYLINETQYNVVEKAFRIKKDMSLDTNLAIHHLINFSCFLALAIFSFISIKRLS